MLSDLVMKKNQMPYPPLLHWILVPGVWLGIEYELARAIQVFIYPLAVLSIMYVANRIGYSNPSTAGLLLISSPAFYDRLVQVQPQGIDMILYPFVILSLYEKNWKLFSLLSIVLIYNHGVVAIAMMGGTYLYLLYKRKYKMLVIITVASLPIMVPYLKYMIAGMQDMLGIATGQEILFLKYPLVYSLLYVATPLLIIPLMKGIDIMNPLHQMLIMNIVTSSIMTPFTGERFLCYMVPNIALLATETLNTTYLLYLSPVIGIMHLQPWYLLFSGKFHVL
jgi:hypothetical protein